ncbi:hypothetical protein WN943_018385 [Citrus x changshan-huyou]
MCHKEKSPGQPVRRSDNVVQDPEVVLTKGSIKRAKMGQTQQRKCSRCGVSGHNVRKCKQKIRQNQPLDDCSSQYMDIYCNRNIFGRHGVDITDSSRIPSEHPHNRNMSISKTNTDDGVPLGSLSDSWLSQFAATTDSDTSIPTINTSTFTGRFTHIATSSSTPTNYGGIQN